MREHCARIGTRITERLRQGVATAFLLSHLSKKLKCIGTSVARAIVVLGLLAVADIEPVWAVVPDTECPDQGGSYFCVPSNETQPAGWSPLIEGCFAAPFPAPEEAASFGAGCLSQSDPTCDYVNPSVRPDIDNNYVVALDQVCTYEDGSQTVTHFDNGFIASWGPGIYACADANFELTDATPPRCACTSPECNCQVEPLTEITDPISKEFEDKNGDVVDFSGLSPTMNNALQCLEQHSGQGRSGFVTSAWRPYDYQAHLREIAKKRAVLNDPKNLAIPACGPIRDAVNAEFAKHGLLPP